MTQTQSTQLVVIFSDQKHYTGKMPKSNGSAGSCLFSCQLAQTLAFNPPHQLGWREVGQWKLPSMMTCQRLLLSLTLFSSSPSFPNKKLVGYYKTGSISWIKWRYDISIPCGVTLSWPSGLSSSTQKSYLSRVWGIAMLVQDAQVCGLAFNDTAYCHWAYIIP